MRLKQGHNGLSCRENEVYYLHHISQNGLLKRTLAAGCVLPRLKPVGLTPSDKIRPDGRTLFAFTYGKSRCRDATCADTFSATAPSKTETSTGRAAAEADERK